MTTFAGLALLPDADVAGLSFGLADHGLYGHRGYSHSLLFATAIAGLVYVVARRWGTRPGFSALLAFLAVGSHGLLDAMTYRTRGIPFFWPFDEMRVVFPWRPIPPAPTGADFFSKRGLEVAGVEMVYFLPLVLAALLPGLATWRRWGARLLATPSRQTCLGTPVAREPARLLSPEPALAGDPMPRALVLGGSRGAVGVAPAYRLTGAVALVALCLVIAQVYLSQSRVVAWIEHSTQQNLAVSLMRNPQFRHLH